MDGSAWGIAARGDGDHGLGDVDAGLAVFDQVTPARHPAEAALHHPSAGRNIRAFLLAGPSGDPTVKSRQAALSISLS